MELDVIGALPALCTESSALLQHQQTRLMQIERPFRGLGALIAFVGVALGMLCFVRANADSMALATGAALALSAAFEAAGAMTKVFDAALHALAAFRA